MAFRFLLEGLISIVITHGVFVDGGMLLKFGRLPLFFPLLLRFSSTWQSLEMMGKKMLSPTILVPEKPCSE